MKKKNAFLKLDEFGTAIGLSKLDKEIIRQKNLIINYLKNVRIKKGLSQLDIAKRLSTHQPAIARMETGQVGNISFDFLIRVALVMGIELKLVQHKNAA